MTLPLQRILSSSLSSEDQINQIRGLLQASDANPMYTAPELEEVGKIVNKMTELERKELIDVIEVERIQQEDGTYKIVTKIERRKDIVESNVIKPTSVRLGPIEMGVKPLYIPGVIRTYAIRPIRYCYHSIKTPCWAVTKLFLQIISGTLNIAATVCEELELLFKLKFDEAPIKDDGDIRHFDSGTNRGLFDFNNDVKPKNVIINPKLKGGYRNAGNTCYTATVLQCLNSLPYFACYLSENTPLTKMENETDKKLETRQAIKNQLNKVLSQSKEHMIVDPQEITTLLRALNLYYRNGNRDKFPIFSQECLLELANAIFEILQVGNVNYFNRYTFTYKSKNLQNFMKVIAAQFITSANNLMSILGNERVPSKLPAESEEHFVLRKKLWIDLRELINYDPNKIDPKERHKVVEAKNAAANKLIEDYMTITKGTIPYKDKVKQDINIDALALELCALFEVTEDLAFPAEQIRVDKNWASVGAYIPASESPAKLQSFAFEQIEHPESYPCSFHSNASVIPVPPNMTTTHTTRLQIPLDNNGKPKETEVPVILNIALERYGATKNRNAVEISEELKVEVEDSKEHVLIYKLYSVGVHLGSTKNSGHYIAYVKEIIDGKQEWVCYNDSSARIVSDEEVQGVISKDGYVAFYEYQEIVKK
jgi:hypothetical protein